MNDCQNVEIREALPELVHGVLAEPARTRVQDHVTDCGDCAAELAIIRAVLAVAPAVSVDVSRISAAIPPYRRRSMGIRRVYVELAAACLVGAIGVSAFAVHSSATHQASVGAASSGLVLVSTSDLSDDGLAQLTRDLDKLQALPPADPETVTPAALEAATDGTTQPSSPGDSA